LYAEWKACERLRIRPKDVKDKWDDNDVMTQALIIAYNHIRDIEDAETSSNMLEAMLGSRLT